MGGRGQGGPEASAVYFPGTGQRQFRGAVPPGAFNWFAQSTARYGGAPGFGGLGRLTRQDIPPEWLGDPRYADFISWLQQEGVLPPEEGAPIPPEYGVTPLPGPTVPPPAGAPEPGPEPVAPPPDGGEGYFPGAPTAPAEAPPGPSPAEPDIPAGEPGLGEWQPGESPQMPGSPDIYSGGPGDVPIEGDEDELGEFFGDDEGDRERERERA